MFKRNYINLILFLITFSTTLLAGALQRGVNPLESPYEIWRGLPFAVTLLMILGAHEFGHYFMSRKHYVDVTLPYFIPAPSFIGTFGAFIKMKSPIMERKILMDIGVAGPLAGFLLALPTLVVGLLLSETTTHTGTSSIKLGSSLIFSFFSWIVFGSMPDQIDLVLHPVAFSAWIGLLVTCFNLIPVGQLDGGHIAYAMFGDRQRIISRIVVVLIVILGIFFWSGWLIWAAILVLMGMDHPPVYYDSIPLDKGRRAIGCLALVIFILCFTPVPF
jgi:membrane-associated protease RseP (regulator of RpoE activity)